MSGPGLDHRKVRRDDSHLTEKKVHFRSACVPGWFGVVVWHGTARMMVPARCTTNSSASVASCRSLALRPPARNPFYPCPHANCPDLGVLICMLLAAIEPVLTEAGYLLDRAESTGVIPPSNDYRSTLAIYGNQFLRMRTKSHRAPGILQQLKVAVQHNLTYRLYALSSQVEAIKIKIELAMDELQLTSLSISQSATVPTQPWPTPMNNMRLTCHEVKRCIAVIVAAIVVTNIVERISHLHRLTLLPRCSAEPVNLSSDHVFYSPDA